jgi:hypothetical protein
MSRLYNVCLLIASFLFLSGASPAQGPIIKDPIYVRIENGWTGLYAHEDEYAEYSLKGPEIKLQDAYHALIKPNLGAMVTFADKKEFGDQPDLLAAHLQWELSYWRKHAAKVESAGRNDLSRGRTDLRITEIKLYNGKGSQINVYCLALASKEGVFVLSISGPSEAAGNNIDPLVKQIADSFRLVRWPLDAEEVKRVSMEIKSRQ